jgi:hypothetical protein
MNPSEPRLLRVEAVADLPVLWATLQRLDLPATLDRHFPPPPHWKGPLTPGEVLAVWLLFLVSQGDHCLNHVQPWVAQHQGALAALLGKPVLASDAHDDRLADWLSRLSRGGAFAALERDLKLVAAGFAVDVALTATVAGQPVNWTERRWLVRSPAYAQGQEAALERRLAKAEAAWRDLPARKQGKERLFHAELLRAAEALVAREGVEGLLRYTVQARMTTRQVRASRDRPARREAEVYFAVAVCRDAERIGEKKRESGWQVYGTNAVALALAPVVWAYRGQYRIEDDWSRLKGRSLGLTPVSLQDAGRIQGLVYLLSLALRALTLLEWVARERLRQQRAKLQGIYAGQPGRTTDRPSAELLLGVLKTISISVVEVNGRIHALLSPLTEVQRRLLGLWDLPPGLYENVARGFPQPP